MVIYDLPSRFSTGRDVPYGKSTQLFRPNLNTPGGGKIKAGIYIGYKVGRYILSRPWAKGTITGTAIGTGLGLVGTIQTDSPSNSYNQAYGQYRKRTTNKRNRRKYRVSSSRCPKCC